MAHDPSLDAQNIADLRAVLPCPVVQVHYRCRRRGSPDHPFPTPLHDAATGYDWVYENLLAKRAISRPGRSGLVGRIAIVGELLGGSLATSLALTECRIGEPGIVAAAVSSPIVDWPAFDDDLHDPVDTTNPKDSLPNLTLRALLDHRRTLFRRPDAYFDPFASPILFFRSAGAAIPPPDPVEVDPHQAGMPRDDDMDLLAQLSRDEGEAGQDYFRAQLALRTAAAPKPVRSSEAIWGEILYPTTAAAAAAVKKQRKASRRYPSPALKLRLPPFHITTGAAREALLHGQNAELARLLRKSDARQLQRDEAEGNGDGGGRSDPPSGDDGMAELAPSRAGLGLWDAGPEGRARLSGAAQWLRGTLFHGS